PKDQKTTGPRTTGTGPEGRGQRTEERAERTKEQRSREEPLRYEIRFALSWPFGYPRLRKLSCFAPIGLMGGRWTSRKKIRRQLDRERGRGPAFVGIRRNRPAFVQLRRCKELREGGGEVGEEIAFG